MYRTKIHWPLLLRCACLFLCLNTATTALAVDSRAKGFEQVESSGFRYPFPEPFTDVSEEATWHTPPPATTPAAKTSEPQAITPTKAYPPISARVAIIIDDIGYNLKQGLRSARFPASLTLAVLPHSPNGLALAELGFEEGKSIMLHAPMSNIKQTPLDPGGLTADMLRDEFLLTLRGNLQSIPHVIGINNHMGSYLTQLPEPMRWLMNELKQQQLFFIDSRTSADSRAWEIATEQGLASRKRDVFLDHERSVKAITQQFEQMINLAKRRGSALAIGHPYPETLQVLEQMVPQLRQQGIQLVPIELLLNAPAAQQETLSSI